MGSAGLKLCGYTGLCPRVNQSGDKDRRVGKSVITFHVTPKADVKERVKKMKDRDRNRTDTCPRGPRR